MYGELINVWPATWGEIWVKLGKDPASPKDLFSELYSELAQSLITPLDAQILADRCNDPAKARIAFRKTKPHEFSGERILIDFFERAFGVLEDLNGDALSNKYFNLLAAFIDKFNLRYDLRRPCTLCPTLPGVFSGLIRELRTVTGQDIHLDTLMKEFENSMRDLKTDTSDGRIKTCIQKQINLLEAMGRTCPGITQNTLGGICEQLHTWPHNKIKEAMKNLYGFTSDYPGIRHGGTSTNALRPIDMRDMVAISVLLTGFTPYLNHQLNSDGAYRGH